MNQQHPVEIIAGIRAITRVRSGCGGGSGRDWRRAVKRRAFCLMHLRFDVSTFHLINNPHCRILAYLFSECAGLGMRMKHGNLYLS